MDRGTLAPSGVERSARQIAWFDTHASPFVDGFVGVSKELVAESPPSRAG
jgi:hypothetical protein